MRRESRNTSSPLRPSASDTTDTITTADTVWRSETAPDTATAVPRRASRARNREEITSLPCPGPIACSTPYRNAIHATPSAGPATSPSRRRRSSRESAWLS